MLKETVDTCDKVNNLLTGVSLRAGLLMKRVQDEPALRGLGEIVDICTEAATYTHSLQKKITRNEMERL
jgi:hypothetical protein